MKPFDRREFLHGFAGTVAAATAGVLPGVALAAAPGNKRLVVLMLPGGMDGVAAVAPYADLNYGRVRGSLAVSPPDNGGVLLGLDGFFGLHPALKPIHSAYEEGYLLPLHAVGVSRSRSHFRSQAILERGVLDPRSVSDGWLNRVLQHFEIPTGGTALTMGRAIPRILRGVADVGSWAPQSLPPAPTDFLEAVRSLYRKDALLGPALTQGIRLRAETDRILDNASRNSQIGWNIQRAAQTAGGLLAAPDGPRIAVLQLGGWDTHRRQGRVGGRIGALFSRLAGALDSLRGSMSAVWDKTVIITVSEFGRTVPANGSGGTDHGTGGVVFLYGGAVKGGAGAYGLAGTDAGRL